jgi:hypothetical protein
VSIDSRKRSGLSPSRTLPPYQCPQVLPGPSSWDNATLFAQPSTSSSYQPPSVSSQLPKPPKPDATYLLLHASVQPSTSSSKLPPTVSNQSSSTSNQFVDPLSDAKNAWKCPAISKIFFMF